MDGRRRWFRVDVALTVDEVALDGVEVDVDVVGLGRHACSIPYSRTTSHPVLCVRAFRTSFLGVSPFPGFAAQVHHNPEPGNI